jgi:hypothetical protein
VSLRPDRGVFRSGGAWMAGTSPAMTEGASK